AKDSERAVGDAAKQAFPGECRREEVDAAGLEDGADDNGNHDELEPPRKADVEHLVFQRALLADGVQVRGGRRMLDDVVVHVMGRDGGVLDQLAAGFRVFRLVHHAPPLLAFKNYAVARFASSCARMGCGKVMPSRSKACLMRISMSPRRSSQSPL